MPNHGSVGDAEEDYRCQECIDRVIEAVRELMDKVYADGDPDGVTVMVAFSEHESHEVISVPLYWEHRSRDTGEDLRDPVSDRCDRRCAEALPEPREFKAVVGDA